MALPKGLTAGIADLKRMYDPIMDQRVGVCLTEADMRLAQLEQAKRRADYANHTADALRYGTPVSGRYDPLQMIAMRLRTPEGMSTGFQHISVCERPGKVFVFVVAKDQPTIIEDDPILFPSDTLIAALHLLKG